MHTQVRALAAALDQQHKPFAPITVRAKRATLRKHFKPRQRGGPLYLNDHEIKPAAVKRGSVTEGELWHG